MTLMHDSFQHASAREDAAASKVLADAPVWSVRVMVPKLVPAAPRAVSGRGVLVSVRDFAPRSFQANRSDTPTCPTLRSSLLAGSFNIL